MKKILLLLAFVLPLSLYSIDLFHDKGGDLKTLKDGKTHTVYFVPINENYDDPNDWHYVNLEYKKEGNDWLCLSYSNKEITKANTFFNELGGFVGDIKTCPFVDSFFFTDHDLEQHLDACPNYIGLDYNF